MLKVATWNVNSVRMRKVPNAEFPADVFLAAGYHPLYAGQTSYNGVAILSRGTGTDIVTESAGLERSVTPDPGGCFR